MNKENKMILELSISNIYTTVYCLPVTLSSLCIMIMKKNERREEKKGNLTTKRYHNKPHTDLGGKHKGRERGIFILILVPFKI
jgi:hypothetical protein